MNTQNNDNRDEELERIISPFRNAEPPPESFHRWRASLRSAENSAKNRLIDTIAQNSGLKTILFINALVMLCLIVLLTVPLTKTIRAGHLIHIKLRRAENTDFSRIAPSLNKVHIAEKKFSVHSVGAQQTEGLEFALVDSHNTTEESARLIHAISEITDNDNTEKFSVIPIDIPLRKPALSHLRAYFFDHQICAHKTVLSNIFNDALSKSGFNQNYSPDCPYTKDFGVIARLLSRDRAYNTVSGMIITDDILRISVQK